MCAISVDNLDATEQWTQRGLEFGERRPAAAYWAGPLLNNLGWAYYDAGDHRRALELFEQALEVRLRDPENEAAIAFAREAVETARQALASKPLAGRRLEALETVVRQRFPGGDGSDVDVRARARGELVVQRTRSHTRDLRVGPAAAEEIRAAPLAERLRASPGGSKVSNRSAPSRIRIEVERTRPFNVPVLPESFLQLAQWQ